MKKTVSGVYLALIFFFLYAPIVLMIFFSFNSNATQITNFESFTLKHYIDIFKNENLMNALSNTLIIAFLSSFFSAILGTCGAIGIFNLRKKARTAVLNVSNLPIINPEIVTGISLMLIFILIFGKNLGFFTVLIAHIVFNTPYIVLNILPRLRRMDMNMYEAAMDLGCRPFQAFFKVVFAENLPGVFCGMLIAFTYSVDDFVITYFTGGSFQTLSIFINNSLKKGVKPWMLSLSGLLFLIILFVLILMNIREVIEEKREKNKVKI